MKAAMTTNYGPASVLETRDVPRPEIGERDVLVQVHASPVTAGDRRLRAADFPGASAIVGRLMFGLFRPRKPVQGTMFAGRVVAIGAAVVDYAVGDDVFGSADRGAYAEYIAVSDESQMALMPPGVSYEEAAEVPYGGGTALHFLRDVAKVQAGERVLVVGASGGVGRFAVQIAKHFGAEVTAVCSRRNADFVRELGADHVIDYATENFTNNGQRYDVIFDIADATTFGACRRSLTDRGRFVTLFMTAGALFWMAVTSRGTGPKAFCGVALGSRENTATLRDLLAEGAIRPVIAERYPFERIVDAHAEADKSRSQGAVMLTVSALH